MLLNGRVAIVTGAGSGIGRSTALRLAVEGARVVIADVDDTAGTATSKTVADAGGNARFIQANIAQKLDVHNLIAATLEAYGRIDVMVANAGILDQTPFLDLKESEFDRVLGVNLKGTFLCCQAAAKQMVKQVEAGEKPGAIITVSSVNAIFGLPDHAAYAVSKGGVTQLMRSMAMALAPFGIRVNAVGPGTIATRMTEAYAEDEAVQDAILSRTPLGRVGKPEEIAAIIAWLASSQSSYVTGETIYADGGRLGLNLAMPNSD